MQTILKNHILEIKINSKGAELCAINNLKNGKNYLWDANPKYWNRSSPVLFPFVGAVKNKEYRYDGATYSMNQHGFARDLEFTLISMTENEVWYSLQDNEDTYKIYPFHFWLEIGYRLEENNIVVMWKVKNTDTKTIYFSIGAHPAFFCPLNTEETQTDCWLKFERKDKTILDKLILTDFGSGGCVTTRKSEQKLESNGLLAVSENRFDNDALVIENNQVQRISLLDKNKKEYLAVSFDSPLVGVWSPPKKHAPFVCIEPWYGRCDSEIFDGELKDREWENQLDIDEKFFAEYKIEIL